MTKLRDLDATFVAKYDAAADSFVEQPEIEGAQGVMFICPKCQGHCVLCWFRNPRNAPPVPDTADPGAAKDGKPASRWIAAGSSLDDLSLEPSVNLDTEQAREALKQNPNVCLWHGWVKNGEAA